jgi:hypothetical protein
MRFDVLFVSCVSPRPFGPRIDGFGSQPGFVVPTTPWLESPRPFGPRIDGFGSQPGFVVPTTPWLESPRPFGPRIDGFGSQPGFVVPTTPWLESPRPFGPRIDGFRSHPGFVVSTTPWLATRVRRSDAPLARVSSALWASVIADIIVTANACRPNGPSRSLRRPKSW